MNAPQRQPSKTERQEPFNASDPEQIHKRQQNTKEIELRKVAGLKLIVENADARLWLWDLISFCGMYRTSFTGNSETFMREGQRNVGLKIHADLAKNFPESLITMMREAEATQTQGGS